jgi:Na+/proline symporter
LSTVDTTLIASGSLVAHNLYLPLRKNASDAHKVFANRLAVACFGVVAYALALSSDSVYELVEAASAFGSAGILVCVMFGLFSKAGGEKTALATLVTGVAMYGVQEHVVEAGHPFLISIASALVVYAMGAALEAREEIEAADVAE